MVTKLGKMLRFIRVEENESMRDMAGRLSLSPSYLSAIENGKRNIPNDFESLLSNRYDLNSDRIEELKSAIEHSREKLNIDISKLDGNRKELLFAITNGEADDEMVDEMLKIVRRNKINEDI